MTRVESELIVEDAIGVCSVREDTRCAGRSGGEPARPGRALDLGTGTGYVGLYLAQRGWKVEAVDISPRALTLAQRNAERNRLKMGIYASNLFDNVTGRFDVITFNPPLRTDETEVSRVFFSLLRRVPSISRWLMRLFGGLFESDRHGFLMQVFAGARRHLNPGGTLLLLISQDETDQLAALPGVRLARTAPIARMPRQYISEFRFKRLT